MTVTSSSSSGVCPPGHIRDDVGPGTVTMFEQTRQR